MKTCEKHRNYNSKWHEPHCLICKIEELSREIAREEIRLYADLPTKDTSTPEGTLKCDKTNHKGTMWY